MAENKTRPTDTPVAEVLAATQPARRREDAERLHELFRAVTGEPGVVWTGGIIGYGTYDYTYASGRSGTWLKTGFAARKTSLTLYLMSGAERYAELLDALGPHKTGVSCLYLKRLADVDEDVLRKLIARSVADVGAGDVDYGGC